MTTATAIASTGTAAGASAPRYRTPQYSGSWPSAYLSSAPENTASKTVGIVFLLAVAAVVTLVVLGLTV